MTIESDEPRALLFAQMKLPPLPEYSADTIILRDVKLPPEISN